MKLIAQGTFGKVYLIGNEVQKVVYFSQYLYSQDNNKNDQKYHQKFIDDNFDEFIVLSKLNHPNIIKYVNHQFFRNRGILTMEYGGKDLSNVVLNEELVKKMLFQISSALNYLHQWYIHRDLKPANIVMNENHIFKIIDFGIIIDKEDTDMHPSIGTLWYRSIEQLFMEKNYTTAVDIWALGCIFAEKINNCPLFPGNLEISQIYRITRLLGCPNKSQNLNINIYPNLYPFQYEGVKMNDPIAQDLISKMLDYNFKTRITAYEILNHPYFQ